MNFIAEIASKNFLTNPWTLVGLWCSPPDIPFVTSDLMLHCLITLTPQTGFTPQGPSWKSTKSKLKNRTGLQIHGFGLPKKYNFLCRSFSQDVCRFVRWTGEIETTEVTLRFANDIRSSGGPILVASIDTFIWVPRRFNLSECVRWQIENGYLRFRLAPHFRLRKSDWRGFPNVPGDHFVEVVQCHHLRQG